METAMLDRIEGTSSVPTPIHVSKRACCIISELLIDDDGVALDGIVRWMVTDRALFREATRYILKRKGDSVRLRILGTDYPGTIMGTSAQGYQIAFDQPIDAETVVDLVERHLTDE